jgi:hypothetical protein
MDHWTRPDFIEIKMDAEIGSYQEDYEPLRDEVRPPQQRSALGVAPTQGDQAR